MISLPLAGAKVMPAGGSDFLDTILFIVAGGTMAVVVLGVLFGVVQAFQDAF